MSGETKSEEEEFTQFNGQTMRILAGGRWSGSPGSW
jgi:hypothetical protein